MSINLRHLHAFREVARLKSVSAASRAVHLSQPAITQAIGNLERQFGTALLVRNPSGVSLTAAGEIAVTRIERALAVLHEAAVDIAGHGALRSVAHTMRLLRVAHIDALAAVVEHRTFSAAARARGVSQPVIHRAARELERCLEIPLFENTSFGVTPTRDAVRLARKALIAFAEIEQARVEIAALAGGERGSTIIGAMPLARSYLLPSALIAFAAEYPEHRVEIVDGSYDFLLSALQSAQADVLIGAMREADAVPSGVTQEWLFDDPLSIVMRAGHPLAQRRRVSARTLARYDWVAPRAMSPLRSHFKQLFASAGLPVPNTSIECNSLAAARALLLESDRVMLLSAHQVHHDVQAGLLATLPHPAGRVVRPIGVTYRYNWKPTRTQERFLSLLRARAARL